MTMDHNNISWKLIETYFRDNPNVLVAHHLDSYNDFFKNGIKNIIRENNPFRWIEEENKDNKDKRNEVLFYIGGKDGSKLYYGKPIIYDNHHSHYMYPNEARLRNMNYGISIHYDVDVDVIFYGNDDADHREKAVHSFTLNNIYLGKFPIMVQSELCILYSLNKEVRFQAGECRNDMGGYFIIDGKEKVVIPQEKFADNMLYIREYPKGEEYSHSAVIRSMSEDSSKPIRTMSIHIIAPSSKYTNNQIVVSVPNVKKPVPLFILMRALGVISDKHIIQICLLDMDKNSDMVDLFIPSIHDACMIFTQLNALQFMAELTKRGTINGVLEILSDYFLPHIGELNFMHKAYFVGYMVFKLLKVYLKDEKPTDRDNFKYKRVELTGDLLYDLFREYYLLQKKHISQHIDKEYYYHNASYQDNDESKDLLVKNKDKYKKNHAHAKKDDYNEDSHSAMERFVSVIESKYKQFFSERIVEKGFKKAFKGSWGSQPNTSRVGIVQDLNRLSWFTFMSHLRKINLSIDPTAKIVGPRLLNSSQWGFIDPIDTPDGANIGVHKHLAISTYITNGCSSKPLIDWIYANTPVQPILKCEPSYIYEYTKLFVNGNWIGVIDEPLELIRKIKLYRRNGILPVYISASFNIEYNEICLYTDSGRLTRPVYYMDIIHDNRSRISYERKSVMDKITKENASWQQIISGFHKKADELFDSKKNTYYDMHTLYPSTDEKMLEENKSILDFVDTSEEESALIAVNKEDLLKNKYFTHLEIDPSLLLGIMGNSIIYPEHNPLARNSFSCGQSKQAVSIYHSNFQNRIDKMGIVLNYGQIPLVKSRYLEYMNNEEHPYGINAVVAIMCYTGYNVEDAILINEGSILRGMFRTTYYSSYEAREDSSKVGGANDSKFANIEKNNVLRKKKGFDYSFLDDYGLIQENTELNDKIILIGKINASTETKNAWIDDSVKPKKGQLGFVDKSFITTVEEGFNLAKVRIREERIPSIGDKMASRAGQKGTIGLIIPEENMPFLEDGTRPDLIINPHALPSRMTIGQIIESLLGIACVQYGMYGDCTAFQTMGSNYTTYGPLLTEAGFHHSGNHILYNGMTGEQIQSNIYMGPTYYMRLKHMVKDKINYRARGPNQQLTRQPIQGRANDGGLRIGEMERDGIAAHGLAHFLNESFMVRGDEYTMAVCNNSGAIAIYNEAKNLFLSPYADGPFHIDPTNINTDTNITKFGRSFSVVKIPYSFKLLIQELQVMNVFMRIITDANIDQLMSMSYSNNANILMNDTNKELNDATVKQYLTHIDLKMKKNEPSKQEQKEQDQIPRPLYSDEFLSPPSPQYIPGNPAFGKDYLETKSRHNIFLAHLPMHPQPHHNIFLAMVIFIENLALPRTVLNLIKALMEP